MAEVVILVFLTVPSDDSAIQKDTKLLHGRWEAVSVERKGAKQPLEKAGFQAIVCADASEFAKQKEIIGTAAFKVALDPSRSPRSLLATASVEGKEAGKIAAIYEVDGDRLRLCFGDPARPPTEFKTTAAEDDRNMLMELKRVAKLPRERNPITDAKVDRARLTVLLLTRAVQAWTLKYDGDPPAKLEDLLNPPGGLAFIEGGKDALTDPWGQPYRYDPKGPKNDGKQPDIWSEGPPGKKQPIGNWSDEKPKDRGRE